MELMMKIGELCYADVAAVALPMLGKAFSDRSGAVAMAAQTAAGVPQPLVRQLVEEITDQRLNQLLAAFVMENKAQVLTAVNELSEKNAIGVKIADLSVTPRLEIRVRIGQLDYLRVITLLLPLVKEKMMEMGGPAVLLRPVIRNATAEQISGLLDQLLGSRKDAFLVSVVNRCSGRLMDMIHDAAHRKHIHVRITELQAME